MMWKLVVIWILIKAIVIMAIVVPQASAQSARDVHDAIVSACGCQIISVVVGNPYDKTTWSIQFGPGVTSAQKAAAQAALAGFSGPPAPWQSSPAENNHP